MNESILEAMKEAIEVACIVKAKGHDCFVSYIPHVDQFEVRFFLGGWESNILDDSAEDPSLKSIVHLEGILASSCPAATIREAMTSVLEIIKTHESK